jgi:hypothetical protein
MLLSIRSRTWEHHGENDMAKQVTVNFWRCNVTKQIRIGYWRDNGVFETLSTVRVKGREYSDAEVRVAMAAVKESLTAQGAA